MKHASIDFTKLIVAKIAGLYQAEKKYIKAYAKLRTVAYTDELSAALAPSGTEIESHLSRLKQIQDLLKQKTEKTCSAADQEFLRLINEASRFKNETSIRRDLDILQLAKIVIQAKVASYESLYLMATANNIEHVPLLLEQSMKDNKNTAAYLSQIEQNIIYPQMAKTETS